MATSGRFGRALMASCLVLVIYKTAAVNDYDATLILPRLHLLGYNTQTVPRDRDSATLDGNLYFAAREQFEDDHPNQHGWELWSTNGVTATLCTE